MSLQERVQPITESMRATKEEWVATSPENTDIHITLHFWRGEEVVAMVIVPVDRDNALQVAHMGIIGFAATTASITFESYHSSLPESPITGETWYANEMQYVHEKYPDASERGWVDSCITTIAHEKGGECAMSSANYQIKDGQVAWGEVIVKEGADQAGGRMFAFMQRAMETPTIMEMITQRSKEHPIAAMMAGLIEDEEARLFHTDMATYRSLAEKLEIIQAVLVAKPGSARAELITERLGEPANGPLDVQL